jgi:ubiquinone biosynthesis protein COQ4
MNATITMPNASLTTNPIAAEAQAVHAALEGRRWDRFVIAVRALRNLLRDPEDTRQVFLIQIAFNAPHLPGVLARFLMEEGGEALLRDRASIDSTSVDYDALRALPADTLGGAYVRFLDDNGLDPDLFQAPPGMPEVPAYVAKRMRQSHDIWHVVTGCQTDIPGEIELLGFSHAQTGMPGLRMLARVGALRFSLRHRGVWRALRRGRRRGAAARSLMTVRWESMWEVPLSEVRTSLGISE